MSAVNEIDELLRERDSFGQDAESESSKRWLWFWAAMMAATVPMLIPYLIGLWGFEHYRYVPFVFLVVGYLVWTRSDHVVRAPYGWGGWTLVSIGMLATLGAILIPSLWFAGIAFVTLAAAMIGSMRSREERTLIGCAVPLLMLIQLPVDLDRRLINDLQSVTTDLSSVVLDVIGVPHAINGNTVQLVSRELFVAEACSGVQSVFTLAFIACVIVAVNRRRLWLMPLYLLVSVFLAIAGNTIRVTTVAVAEHWFARDLSSGWQHDVLGYITLGIATLFLLSFDQLIVTLLHPATASSDGAMDNPLLRAWNYLVADWRFTTDDAVYGSAVTKEPKVSQRKQGFMDQLVMNRTGWMASLAIFAVLGLFAAVQATRVEIDRAPQQLVGSYVLFNPKPELLQGQFSAVVVGEHQINRNGQDPRLGQNADLWEFAVTGTPLRGQVVVSQTYRGWHELCVCYKNMDWQELSREVTELKNENNPGDPPTSFITARFKNNQDEFGYLLFSAVNENGTIPDAPGNFGAFQARLKSRLEREGIITAKELAMVQIWVVSPQKIPAELLAKLQSDFVEIRSRIATSMVQDAIGKNTTTTTALRSNTEG
jgi:exosortase